MKTDRIIELQNENVKTLMVTLTKPTKGCKYGLLDISGSANGNPHDLWLWSTGKKKVIDRIYLGSKNISQNNIELLESLSEFAVIEQNPYARGWHYGVNGLYYGSRNQKAAR